MRFRYLQDEGKFRGIDEEHMLHGAFILEKERQVQSETPHQIHTNSNTCTGQSLEDYHVINNQHKQRYTHKPSPLD